MKKTTNKGFSLVELIIVIAIMAILIGVLAPQYIKYVEKSRKSADEDLVDSVIGAIKTSCSDEIYSESLNDGMGVTISGTGISGASGALNTALQEYLGSDYSSSNKNKLKSKAYSGDTYWVCVNKTSFDTLEVKTNFSKK